MRGDHEGSQVAHAFVVPPLVDNGTVGLLDAAVENGARELVIDLTAATRVDVEAVVLLAWLAQRLENAGGKLKVTARRARDGARVTRTLWTGDPTCVLGVHPVLDKTILHLLSGGTGGVASQ